MIGTCLVTADGNDSPRNQATAFQERIQFRIATHEVAKENRGFDGIAPAEDFLTEFPTDYRTDHPVRGEPGERICIEDFGPLVGIVP